MSGIDPRTGRHFGDHGTAVQAINYALDHEPDDGMTFLKAWREGDLGEWPEFYAWLAPVTPIEEPDDRPEWELRTGFREEDFA